MKNPLTKTLSTSKAKSKHYLGLDLSGAKNQKTTVSVMEYFPQERKTFLLDIYERIPSDLEPSHHHPSDQSLLDLIKEHGPQLSKVGTTGALSFPPSVLAGLITAKGVCGKGTIKKVRALEKKEIKWMNQFVLKMSQIKRAKPKVNPFTPYTQRSVELWIRYRILPSLPPSHQFEIDEALGGARAPLTARMMYLKRFLPKKTLIEVWPKLTISLLAQELRLDRHVITNYRRLDDGLLAREKILDALIKIQGIFIYDRDFKKLSQNLHSFDSFLCAYSALMYDLKQCEGRPSGFPENASWVAFPRMPLGKPLD